MKFKVKFRWKIFMFSVLIYIISLGIVGVVITEKNYYDSLRREIKRSLQEEKNIIVTATLYLKTNQSIDRSIVLQNYASNLVDMFKAENSYIAIYDNNLNLLDGVNLNIIDRNKGLLEANEGNRNYILKQINSSHFLVINDYIEIENEKIIISFTKDITHIDNKRIEEYKFFIFVLFIGLIIVGIITGIMSKVIIKPIELLKEASRKIASGNYQDRLMVDNRDEVGLLAEQFNIMANEIEKKIKALKDESERKQRFIDNLTHELRTPLTAIIGYSDLLISIPYDRKNYYKGLKFINQEGKRILKMVNQLMDLILLKNDNEIIFSNEDIMPILKEAKELLKEKAEDKNVKIIIQGEKLIKRVNKTLFKNVLINLLDNGINASRNGSKIIMGIDRDDNYDFIYIKDEGVGIDKEELNKILEPYYRVDKSRSRKIGGAGLGLSICNEIVKVHGARLIIDSKVGEGTMVKIKFYNSVTS